MNQSDTTPSFGSCFASMALGLAPLFLIMGVAASFGADTVSFNGEQKYGFVALIVVAVFDVIVATILAGLQKLGYIFLNVIKKRKRVVAAP